jgi:secreted Zn-dependent insulinase-like peptidase
VKHTEDGPVWVHPSWDCPEGGAAETECLEKVCEDCFTPAGLPVEVEPEKGVWYLGHYKAPKEFDPKQKWRYPGMAVSLTLTPKKHSEDPTTVLGEAGGNPYGFYYIGAEILVGAIGKILRTSLQQYSLAGMGWGISYDGDFTVSVDGYMMALSSKLKRKEDTTEDLVLGHLAEILLELLSDMSTLEQYAVKETDGKTLEEWLEDAHGEILQGMQNHGPGDQGTITANAVRSQVSMTRKEKMDRLEELKDKAKRKEAAEQVFKDLKEGVVYRALVSGNVQKDGEKGAVSLVTRLLGYLQTEFSPGKPVKSNYRMFEEDNSVVTDNPRKGDPNSWIRFDWRVQGPQLPTRKDRAFLSILDAWLGFSAFTFLRTKNAQGYSAGGRKCGLLDGPQGISVHLMSPVSHDDELSKQITEFKKEIVAFGEGGDFEKWRHGAEKDLMIKDHTTCERHNRMFAYLSMDFRCFEDREKSIKMLQDLKEKDYTNELQDFIAKLLNQKVMEVLVRANAKMSLLEAEDASLARRQGDRQELAAFMEKLRSGDDKSGKFYEHTNTCPAEG